MNPCPCGHATNPNVACRCSPDKASRYLNKVSGPLLDRFDLIVEMSSVSRDELLSATQVAENWAERKNNIARCQQRQQQQRGKLNYQLNNKELDTYAALGEAEKEVLANAMDKLNLSARTVHRSLRVARTIADLRGAEHIGSSDLLEALAFRQSRLIPELAA